MRRLIEAMVKCSDSDFLYFTSPSFSPGMRSAHIWVRDCFSMHDHAHVYLWNLKYFYFDDVIRKIY